MSFFDTRTIWCLVQKYFEYHDQTIKIGEILSLPADEAKSLIDQGLVIETHLAPHAFFYKRTSGRHRHRIGATDRISPAELKKYVARKQAFALPPEWREYAIEQFAPMGEAIAGRRGGMPLAVAWRQLLRSDPILSGLRSAGIEFDIEFESDIALRGYGDFLGMLNDRPDIPLIIKPRAAADKAKDLTSAIDIHLQKLITALVDHILSGLFWLVGSQTAFEIEIIRPVPKTWLMHKSATLSINEEKITRDDSFDRHIEISDLCIVFGGLTHRQAIELLIPAQQLSRLRELEGQGYSEPDTPTSEREFNDREILILEGRMIIQRAETLLLDHLRTGHIKAIQTQSSPGFLAASPIPAMAWHNFDDPELAAPNKKLRDRLASMRLFQSGNEQGYLSLLERDPTAEPMTLGQSSKMGRRNRASTLLQAAKLLETKVNEWSVDRQIEKPTKKVLRNYLENLGFELSEAEIASVWVLGTADHPEIQKGGPPQKSDSQSAKTRKP